METEETVLVEEVDDVVGASEVVVLVVEVVLVVLVLVEREVVGEEEGEGEEEVDAGALTASEFVDADDVLMVCVRRADYGDGTMVMAMMVMVMGDVKEGVRETYS